MMQSANLLDLNHSRNASLTGGAGEYEAATSAPLKPEGNEGTWLFFCLIKPIFYGAKKAHS